MIEDTGARAVTVVKVRDGDTIESNLVVGDVTIHQVHRLTHIDTPERGSVGASEATAFTAQFIGQRVLVVSHGKDRYGRNLTDVYVTYEGEQRNLSELLLQKGYAKVYGK